MSDLPPNASLDEISGEITFLRVVLSTLDVDADDFQEQYNEHAAKLQELEQLEAAKLQELEAAAPRNVPLPSSSPSPSARVPRQLVPQKRRASGRASTLPRRKSKSSHESDYSSDDDDDTEQILSSTTGGMYDYLRKAREEQLKARHKQEEERYRQELEDQKMARRLADQGAGDHPSTPGPSSAEPRRPVPTTSNNGSMNQLLINPSGHVQRRPVIQEPQAPVLESPSRSLAYRQQTPYRGRTRSASATSDDDDVELISANEFRYRTRADLEPAVEEPPIERPGNVSATTQFPRYPQTAYPISNQDSLQNLFGVPSASRDPYALRGNMPGGMPGRGGYSVYQDPQTPVLGTWAIHSGMPTGARSEAFSESQIDDMQRYYGLTDVLNDPRRTNEEIKQLLDNIRPDEEIPVDQRIATPADLQCTLMEHQKLGLAWLKQQEEGSNKGGVLGDDMGLGKTVQALALMLARKSNDVMVKTTLIVAPVALMRQWAKEIESKVVARKKLKVFTLNSTTKSSSSFAKLASYDVVLTTYGMIAHEWKSMMDWKFANPSARSTPPARFPLLGDECTWYRVILDEAQAIKNRHSQTSQGACSLKAHYRLCMTGTPMMNSVEEFYPLLKFLRIPPYNAWDSFNRDFAKPLGSKSTVFENAIRRLQAVMKAVLLRRTKSSTIDGKAILNLPERTCVIDHAVFNQHQQEFYTALETSSKARFNAYLQAGTVNKNYTNALMLLLRLRQCCDHPHMIKDHAEEAPVKGTVDEQEEIAKDFSDEVVAMVRGAAGSFECPICYDAAENPTIFFPCGHDVCAECFTRLSDPSNLAQSGPVGEVGGSIRCPECRERIDINQVISYSIFKRMRLPELCEETEDGADAVPKNEKTAKSEGKSGSDSDDDSDSEDSTDSESEVDNRGNLRDFIVPDDDDDDEEEADEDSSKRKRKGRAKKQKGKKEARKEKKKLTLAELKKRAGTSAAARRKYFKRMRKTWVSSAKVDKTLEILQEIRDADESEKTIVFSQFTTFLDLIEVPLEREGWTWSRYDGSMTVPERNRAVDRFEQSGDCNVMLISLKAGNAGLNLSCASQVVILDPFWNPFVEEQAIDRAHRIGQQRPVTVHRILVPETVEDRIVQLQERKRALVNAALDERAGKTVSRLGAQQLAYLFGLGGGQPPAEQAQGAQ